MKYLKIQSSIKAYGLVEYDKPIALVKAITTETTIDNSDEAKNHTVKQYVTFEYYTSIESYLKGDKPITMTEGSTARVLLYMSDNLLTAENVYSAIGSQVNGHLART